uniref:THAP domain-containing protein 5 n=1 Tax=Nomascus leucogenys TaxID=61853 RepID=A0A2I3HJ16_NOMLE
VMPHYCTAICCKNRRGRNNKDRKLSFYPFPLHDKERLEKWLKNMKQDSRVPSKYQFLCSDHFTPDSLDIRWGIRYLKQTAVPTIFSLPEDNQRKDPSKKKSQKKNLEDEKEVCPKAKSEESVVLNETKKNIVNTNPPAPKTGSIQNYMLTLNLVKQHTGKPESTLETSNLNSTTITLTTSNSESIHQSLETQEVLEVTSSHLANPNFTSNSMEIKSAQENPFLFKSVIAIFVPAENSKPSVNSSLSAQKETTEMEDIDYGTEVLQIEHSYCRQDINREHLWQKVSKLHSKITLLELKELKSLEALIRQLKKDNWLSEENVKIIENRFTTYEVTMI